MFDIKEIDQKVSFTSFQALSLFFFKVISNLLLTLIWLFLLFTSEILCFCSWQLILCQDDMIVILRTLSENLSEKSEVVQTPATLPIPDRASDSASNKESQDSGASGPASSKWMWSHTFKYIVYA